MDRLIATYAVSGYTVASRTANETVLIKRKQFSIALLIIGLLLCVIPLLVYLVVYALQKDEVVVLRVNATEVAPPAVAVRTQSVDDIKWSDDRLSWRDGDAWVDVAIAIPPVCPLSNDLRQWWDGSTWRVVQPGAKHPRLSGR
jgi:hypothetical protein